LVLDILCVTYFLTSIIMHAPQTSDMRQIRQMMLVLPLSSACLSKLWILCLNSLLARSFVHSAAVIVHISGKLKLLLNKITGETLSARYIGHSGGPAVRAARGRSH